MMNQVFVTKPFLPEMDRYFNVIKTLWESNILSNSGELHVALEEQLKSLFNLPGVSLINNGTIALSIALKALGLSGKVITTPYSFVATANSILMAGCEPVFVDIADDSFNLDPNLIDKAYDVGVSAIMPVHVYGTPCDNDVIGHITDRSGLKVIYDAAHAFNVKKDGKSILSWGDLSILSFHATKVFHTFEGGAIVASDPELKNKIDKLKNFGFEENGDVIDCGTNGKMNEAQAAMGLVLLDYLNEILSKRRRWHEFYIEQLKEIGGIRLLEIPKSVEHNYSYFPLLVNESFPLTRDELYNNFREQDIYPRKYFSPLITEYSLYKKYKIVSRHKVSNARKMADSVICLPLYPDLTESDVSRVCDVVKNAGHKSIK